MNILAKLGGASVTDETKQTETIVELRIDDLRLDGGTQSREGINRGHVQALAEARERGVVLPPIEVYFDGQNRWVTDGFHRVQDCKNAGITTIRARVVEGTQREAILASVGKNSDHGLPRTNADKRRAVMTLLQDAEWGHWADREIARIAEASHTFVGQLRAEFNAATGNDDSAKRVYERQGKTQVMDTRDIGKPAPPRNVDGSLLPAEDDLNTPFPVAALAGNDPAIMEAFAGGAETMEDAATGGAKTWDEHLAEAYPSLEETTEAPEFGTVVVSMEDTRTLKRFAEVCSAFIVLAANKSEAVLAWLATNDVDERVEALMRDYAE